MKNLVFLFDVDGVIVDTPHDKAAENAAETWKLFDGDFDFQEFYHKELAALPGMQESEVILEKARQLVHLSYPKRRERIVEFRSQIQSSLDKLISNSNIKGYEDIISIIKEAKKYNIPIAAVSVSENAIKTLNSIDLLAYFDSRTLGAEKYGIKDKQNLYRFAFGKLCGRSHQFPLPTVIVFEDSVGGVQAAKAAEFYCVGLARRDNKSRLVSAGADLVYQNDELQKKGYAGLLKDLGL